VSLLAKIDPPEGQAGGEAEIEPGKRLILVGDDRGVSLADACPGGFIVCRGGPVPCLPASGPLSVES
jgi:hypothetical protein